MADPVATLVAHIQDLSTRLATENKSQRTLINGNAATLNALTTTDKSTVVNALNELKSRIDGAIAASGAVIDDASTSSTTKTYSVTMIRDLVSTSINAVVNGAGSALDTLKELSTALGDNPNFAADITAMISNRVRFDAAQSLTAAQKVQVKANIDAYGALEIGNPDTDFVAIFNAGLL